MKLTDRFKIRDKMTEQMVRHMDSVLDQLEASTIFNKKLFMELQYTTLELFIKVFKQLENNTTPAKTLLDFTENELHDACIRVGSSAVFDTDRGYVMAVMQELTKR
jgi:hypothetical protein